MPLQSNPAFILKEILSKGKLFSEIIWSPPALRGFIIAGIFLFEQKKSFEPRTARWRPRGAGQRRDKFQRSSGAGPFLRAASHLEVAFWGGFILVIKRPASLPRLLWSPEVPPGRLRGKESGRWRVGSRSLGAGPAPAEPRGEAPGGGWGEAGVLQSIENINVGL